jgi:hypothetical protein
MSLEDATMAAIESLQRLLEMTSYPHTRCYRCGRPTYSTATDEHRLVVCVTNESLLVMAERLVCSVNDIQHAQ